jgi:uncharacterized membrane protein
MQDVTTTAGQAPATPWPRGETHYIRRPWLQDISLWILLVGPLTAPLFRWTGIGILQPFADAIYFLGWLVCPKVDVHLMYLGYPLSVCSSCWFAVFGLWTIRVIYGREGEGMGVFSGLVLQPIWDRWDQARASVKLSVLAALFLPWAFDVMAWDTGLWTSPHAFMMLAGYLGGIGAGLLLLPAAAQMRIRTGRPASA